MGNFGGWQVVVRVAKRVGVRFLLAESITAPLLRYAKVSINGLRWSGTPVVGRDTMVVIRMDVLPRVCGGLARSDLGAIQLSFR